MRIMLLTVIAVLIIIFIISFGVCYHVVQEESHIRCVGMMNVASEKLAKTIRGMEMNAMNEFDEVEKHLDSPEAVIAALKSKTSLNPDVRGYFAAFEPDYFPQKGRWFEPYVHQPDSSGNFEVRQVGSERHDYTKSDWYVRAKQSNDSFWSDPYYYYDGTNISGHYCTFVRPVFDMAGRLACVCGADMTFEWLTKELQRIDDENKDNDVQNQDFLYGDIDCYTVVINNDGNCIAHPEGKPVSLTKEQLALSLSQKKAGTIDLQINGVPSTIYYAPIDKVNWFLAVVMSKQNLPKPLLNLGLVLLLVTVSGIIVVWLVSRPKRS